MKNNWKINITPEGKYYIVGQLNDITDRSLALAFQPAVYPDSCVDTLLALRYHNNRPTIPITCHDTIVDACLAAGAGETRLQATVDSHNAVVLTRRAAVRKAQRELWKIRKTLQKNGKGNKMTPQDHTVLMTGTEMMRLASPLIIGLLFLIGWILWDIYRKD